jgi:ribosomal-protein-alanine N-acetyltransferase
MLESARLFIRPFQATDAGLLHLLNSDPEVMRFTGEEPSLNLAESYRTIHHMLIPQFDQFKMGRFALFLPDQKFIGWCGLKKDISTGEVDLGYRLMKKFWGLGYATEASKRILEYGFFDLKLERVIARVLPLNTPSLKVLHKLGMQYRGKSFKDDCAPNFVRYELQRKDYIPCAT